MFEREQETASVQKVVDTREDPQEIFLLRQLKGHYIQQERIEKSWQNLILFDEERDLA